MISQIVYDGYSVSFLYLKNTFQNQGARTKILLPQWILLYSYRILFKGKNYFISSRALIQLILARRYSFHTTSFLSACARESTLEAAAMTQSECSTCYQILMSLPFNGSLRER